jgi:protein-tyrosine phosphatase
LGELQISAGVPLVAASLRPDVAVDAILGVSPVAPTAAATVVAARDRGVKVLREGTIRGDEVEASARGRVVFVCTGNTCRSPMAEVLCRRLLADTLGVAVSELGHAGFEISSAGLAAAEGSPASPEAVDAARALGGELAGHSSRPLTMNMVDRADLLFAMTAGHLRMLKSLRLPVGPEPRLLSVWGEDVPDPIGGPKELYEACAELIRRSVRQRLPQILEG